MRFDRAQRARRIARALLPEHDTAEHDTAEHDADSMTTEPAPPAAPAPREPVTLDYPGLQRALTWLDGLLRVHHAAACVAVERTRSSTDGEDSDPLIEAMRKAHLALLAHPVAAKAAYAALAATGRQFARTPEGAALRTRLESSARLRRATLLWRTITVGMLDEDEHALPPSYLDNLLRSIDRDDLERLIGRAYVGGAPSP